MRILCLQHVPFEGPAAIEEWARARGHELERARLFDPASPHAEAADIIVVMGGPMSVHDEVEHPWLAEEKRFLSAAIEGGVAVFGVCLGAQLLSEALGGEVTRARETEIGWFPVTLSGPGRESAIMGHLPGRFEALHWHGETFSIPPGATLLASTDGCPNQAFAYDGGRVLGLQFHLECTPASLRDLIENAPGDLETPGPLVSSAEDMLASPARFHESHDRLFTLLDAFAANAFA